MTGEFIVHTTARFDRLARTLRKQHQEFTERYKEAIAILRSDPYNQSGHHKIKKLQGVTPEMGQYRLRLRRWRFRYSIYGQEVVLYSCGLRREDTYR